MTIGVNTTHDWTIRVLDATPQSLVLVDVQGDPSFGDEMPSQREQQDVMVRGLQVGRTFADEQGIEVSWSAIDSEEVRAFVDMILFRGDYAPAGASPAISTDPIGGKALKLEATCTPPVGAPRTVSYDRAYWRASLAAAVPSSAWTLTATCYGRTES